MTIKIKIGTPDPPEKKETQATISLKISKTLNGNLLINDHDHIDIMVIPKEGKVVTMPKPFAEVDTYDFQRDLLYALYKGGVTEGPFPQGGPQFGLLEATYPKESDVDSLQAVLLQINEFIKKTENENFVADEYDHNIEDRFTDPNETETTEYGEIPPYQETPAGRTNAPGQYRYAGYGYIY